MASKGTITEAGKDFLIAALDPMHDKQLANLKGWPDLESACSVTRCYKKSLQLSKPAGVSGNWDMVIQTLPIMNSLQMKMSSTRNNNMIQPTVTAGTGTIHPVTVASGATGCSFSLTDYITGALSTNGVDLPNTVLDGRCRMVGMGIEVTNTTAPLNRQGTVTVYRFPQSHALKSTTWFYGLAAAGAVQTPFDASVMTFFPDSLPNAMLLAGTRQWKAEDGAYCVVPFCSAENPALSPDYRQPIFYDDDILDEVGTVNTDNVMFPSPVSSVNDKLIFQANKFAPMQSVGIFFTGLSETSTLTLQVNFYVETFPTFDDTEIITLATPSAPHDPAALALYQHAMNTLPVGVPANFNGFGDWFAGIVSSIAKYGGAALGAAVPGLGPVIAGAGALADSYLAAQTPKTKPRAGNKKQQAARKPPPLPARDKAYQKQMKIMEADKAILKADRAVLRAAKRKGRRRK